MHRAVDLRVRFAFVSEGTSDRGLIPALETLCVRLGALEASGFAPLFERLPGRVGRTVAARLRAALLFDEGVDFICVHRDADSPNATPRRTEIADAATAVDADIPVVPVVPVQETEAWLLLDATAIRRASGNPNGTVGLGLPRPDRVEAIARPKELLLETICRASEQKGRRLRRLRDDFSVIRQVLLHGLDLDGDVRHVPSWRALEDDLRQALSSVQVARATAR